MKSLAALTALQHIQMPSTALERANTGDTAVRQEALTQSASLKFALIHLYMKMILNMRHASIRR